MKWLLVSDLHYSLPQLDWVHGVAGNFDVVVLAGDHLDISSTVAVDAQIVVVLKYLRRIAERTRLVVCSGNHDLNARNGAGERVARWMTRARASGAAGDGDFLELAGSSITVCPWWDGPATCAEVGAQLAGDAARRGSRWIWVYHSPPEASPVSWTGQRHFGDVELSRWIQTYRPDMVLSGHIHQAPFRTGGSWVDKVGSTWVFNPGRQIGPCPAHVIVDLAAGTAEWFSLAGHQGISLAAHSSLGSGWRSEPGSDSAS
jgi:Icc-related predicted phosphoesterase